MDFNFGCVLIQFTAYRLQRGRRPPRRTHAASLRAPRSTFAAAPDPRAGLSQGVRSRGAVKLRGVPRGPQGRADGPAGCRRAIPRRGLFRRHGTLQRQLCRGGLFQDLLRVFSGSVWPTGRAGLGAPEVRSVVYSGGLGCPSSSHTVNQDSPSLCGRISLQDILQAKACRMSVEWGRAGQRGWRRGARGRSVKLPWALNPVQMAFWTIPDTLCAPSRVPFHPVRSERRPSRVQSLRIWSPCESSSSLFFTVFTWRSGEFRQSAFSLLVSLLVLR